MVHVVLLTMDLDNQQDVSEKYEQHHHDGSGRGVQIRSICCKQSIGCGEPLFCTRRKGTSINIPFTAFTPNVKPHSVTTVLEEYGYKSIQINE